MNWHESGFWDFSLDVYARPDMRDACLKLQDEAGADVNILLLCLWLAALRRPALSPDLLERIDREAAPWREGVIGPLRQARRGLADFVGLPEYAELKERIQQAELDGENRAQRELSALAMRLVASERATLPPAEAAAISIGHYLNMLSPERAGLFAETAAFLVRAAF
jgi:uncharacterized protein (TIGR02444 family)